MIGKEYTAMSLGELADAELERLEIGIDDLGTQISSLQEANIRLEREIAEAKGVGARNLQRAAGLYSGLQTERDKWKRDAYAWAPAGVRKGWDREAKEFAAAARRYLDAEDGCGQLWVWDNNLLGKCGIQGLCGDCASKIPHPSPASGAKINVR